LDTDADGIPNCIDACPTIPYGNEVCDGIDNDCDGQVDEGCAAGLEPIQNLTARAKPGKIDLVWTCKPGSVSYNIFRSITPGGPYSLIKSGHVTTYCTYADFGLTNGITYYYRVRWMNSLGQESPDSNEASATPRTR
jgi:hypothetical protein